MRGLLYGRLFTSRLHHPTMRAEKRRYTSTYSVSEMLVETNETSDESLTEKEHDSENVRPYTWTELADRMIWRYFFFMGIYYLGSIIALSMYAFGWHSVPVKSSTILWAMVVGIGTFVGVTAGAHRLWSHRSYKANLPLRTLLMIFYTTMGLNPLFYWIRDHRIHHKYSETDADPHNPRRGFIFSHVGWVVTKRHPDCIRRGREVDMSDIKADPVVMFQKKYSIELRLLLCFIIPGLVPMLFWGETILHSILTQFFIRYVLMLNLVLCVNSVAHRWGNRPYNRSINPADNTIVSLLTLGEGSHNYHHTFPWDYKTSELPYFNATTMFIDTFARIGWVWDRRETSPELIKKVVRHTSYKSEIKGIQ